MSKQRNPRSSSRFPVRIYRATTRKPKNWPYWVFIPLCSITYGIYVIWFTLVAWGYRGEPKPAWIDTAFTFAIPGQIMSFLFIFLPPPIPQLIPGALLGWLMASLVASYSDD